MKIVYIVYNKLHIYPPCMSQIRLIKELGYDIEVIYGNSDENAVKILKSEDIKVTEIRYNNKGNKIKRAFNLYDFRKKLHKYMNKFDNNNTVFWFGNAETSITMKGLLRGKKYIISLLELYDDNDRFRGKLLHGLVENAMTVTVCEETRGYLTKHWYNLNYVPTVFPNKPYGKLPSKRSEPSSEETKKIIEKIKNDKVIIYQGIIMKTAELYETAKALNEIQKDYKLVLLGMDKENVYKDIKKIYKNTVLFDYVPAPLHLEVTSYAMIGLLFYKNNSLNNEYCAPNKIYEYSGFGIPMIGNMIPGLKNTIEVNNAGKCIELNKDNIKNTIIEIENDYDKYSKNSLSFFSKCDLAMLMEDFLKHVKVIMNEEHNK